MLARAIPAMSLYTAAGKRKYLTPTERARFIEAAQQCPRLALRTFCLMLAYTGCRISEALAVRGSAIEVDAGFVAIHSLKKRSDAIVVREIPLPPDLLNALIEADCLSDGDKSKRLWPWSRTQAWTLVKGLMTEADIAAGIHATPKGLRHGFGIHAIRSGVPVNLVQRWLGHSRLETTMIYLQAMGQEEREFAARMW